jgi:hypothetical protein
VPCLAAPAGIAPAQRLGVRVIAEDSAHILWKRLLARTLIDIKVFEFKG